MATKLNKNNATKVGQKKITQKPQKNKTSVKKVSVTKPVKKVEAKGLAKKVATAKPVKKVEAKGLAKKVSTTKPVKKVEAKGSVKKVSATKPVKKVAIKKNENKKPTNQVGQNKFSPHMIVDDKKLKAVVMHEAMPKKQDTKTKTKLEPIKQVKNNNMSDAALLKAAKDALKKVPKEMFSVATGTDTNEHFSKAELEKFKKHVIGLKEDSIEELEMQEAQLRLMEDSESSEENSFSINMNEQTNEAMEREKAFIQTQRTADYIKKLDEALGRIENGSFGICRMCGLRLDSKRMLAVPVTQVCTTFKNTNKHCTPGKVFYETLHPVKAEDYVPEDRATSDEDDN